MLLYNGRSKTIFLVQHTKEM